MPRPPITNHEAALILLSVASMVETTTSSSYRVRAYRRAARELLRLQVRAADSVTPDGELVLPGIGDRMRRTVGDLLSRGDLRFYHDLYASPPPEIVSLMRVPGIGPRIALRLYVELGLGSPEDLVAASLAGRIRVLYRFGERSEARLGEAAQALLAQWDQELAAAA